MTRSITEYEPIFGSWHVTRRLGTGAAGNVYEIERSDEFGITQHSALKVITLPAGGEDEIKAVRFSGMADDQISSYYETAVQRVVSELNMMTRLKGSSHIVSYEDHEIKPHEGGIGWDILVRMELLTPMLDYYSGRTMSEDEVISMGIDLCEGLELCRQYGIVHRDIKPANIFVTDKGDFKLGDFGIARIVEETQTSLSRKGTYTYMAPEIYRGEKYGQNADIYSLGMVMYQCLNDGRNIFVPAYPERYGMEDQETAFAKRIAGKQIPPPNHGSDALKAIVSKACAFSKDRRYQSASEMRADLEALRRGDIEEIAEITGGNETTRRKHLKIKLGAVFALIIMAVAGVFAAVFPWEIESITLTAAGNVIDDRAEIYIGDTLTPQYSISPAHYESETIIFYSSNEDVFTVDKDGMITATGLGEATLEMTAEDHSRDNFTDEIAFIVVPKVTSMTITDASAPVNIDGDAADLNEIEITTGQTMDLDVWLGPERFCQEPVTYTVEDPAIVYAVPLEKASGSSEDAAAARIRLTALKTGETTLELNSGGCTVQKKVTAKDPPVIKTGSGKKKKKKSQKSNSEGSFGDYDYFD